MEKEAGVSVAHNPGGISGLKNGSRALVVNRHIPQVLRNNVLTVEVDHGIRKLLIGIERIAGQTPLKDRIEEMVNYFKYDYPQPKNNEPFSVNTEISQCPWNPAHKLALVGLQGKIIQIENLPSSNIVFLIDVSGSMSDENKLPLLKQSLKLLVDQLRENDKVSLVVMPAMQDWFYPLQMDYKSKPLKKQLINWNLVAHQQAAQVLNWLTKLPPIILLKVEITG